MKRKKLFIGIGVVALLILCVVCYRSFYNPPLGEYVYVERETNYSGIVHSRENCGKIQKGILRMKTDKIIEAFENTNGTVFYCKRCMSYSMIEDYLEEQRQKKLRQEAYNKIEKELRESRISFAKEMIKYTGDSSLYYEAIKTDEQLRKEYLESILNDEPSCESCSDYE